MGPASFSPFGLGFADTAVYVAQYRRKRSTFAIALRGTNPVCLFDWLFGDFMVTKQVPWSYGSPAQIADAQIAFSTALSLNLLQHLRSQPAPPSLMRRARKFLTRLVLGSDRGATVESPDALRGLLDGWTRLAVFAPTPNPGALQKWITDLAKRERHSDAVIGPRCCRVVNRRDIVPSAWAPRDLQRIPELYSMGPVEHDLLQGAVETLTSPSAN